MEATWLNNAQARLLPSLVLRPSSLRLVPFACVGVAAATSAPAADTSCMSLSCKRAVTRLRLTSIVSLAGQTGGYLATDRWQNAAGLPGQGSPSGERGLLGLAVCGFDVVPPLSIELIEDLLLRNFERLASIPREIGGFVAIRFYGVQAGAGPVVRSFGDDFEKSEIWSDTFFVKYLKTESIFKHTEQRRRQFLTIFLLVGEITLKLRISVSSLIF